MKRAAATRHRRLRCRKRRRHLATPPGWQAASRAGNPGNLGLAYAPRWATVPSAEQQEELCSQGRRCGPDRRRPSGGWAEHAAIKVKALVESLAGNVGYVFLLDGTQGRGLTLTL